MGIEDNAERREVSAAVSNELKLYARQRWPLANDKFRKGRLAHIIGVTDRRIKSLWEGDPAAVLREHEATAIRKLQGARKIEEANRVEFQALQARLARLEAAFAAVDPEFFHEQMAALRVSTDAGRGDYVAGSAGETD